MPLISIIVPVYNVASYLPRTIESILSQDMSDFELLMLDDGSTDGSVKVMEEYAARDERLTVVQLNHGGVCRARNAGLERAQGEWIMFMDSDDTLTPGALTAFVHAADADHDMVVGNYEWQRLSGNNYKSDFWTEPCETDVATTVHHLMVYERNRYFGYIWGRIFRRSVIEQAGLRFNENIAYKEGALFQVQFLAASQRPVLGIPAEVYHYEERPGSAMASTNAHYESRRMTNLDACFLIIEEVRRSGFGPKAEEASRQATDKVFLTLRRILWNTPGVHSKEWRYIWSESHRHGMFLRLFTLAATKELGRILSILHLRRK